MTSKRDEHMNKTNCGRKGVDQIMKDREEVARHYECNLRMDTNDNHEQTVTIIASRGDEPRRKWCVGSIQDAANMSIEEWVKRCQFVSGQQRPVFGRSA